MKHKMIVFVCAFWFALALSVQAQTPASEAQSPTIANQQLRAEIKALRRELLQQAIEFQQWKLALITRELQQAQTEQQRLLQEEQLLQHELNELPVVGSNNHETETLRAELTGERTQKLRHRQQPVQERVDTLTTQAQKEEARLQQLTDKLKAESPTR